MFSHCYFMIGIEFDGIIGGSIWQCSAVGSVF